MQSSSSYAGGAFLEYILGCTSIEEVALSKFVEEPAFVWCSGLLLAFLDNGADGAGEASIEP